MGGMLFFIIRGFSFLFLLDMIDMFLVSYVRLRFMVSKFMVYGE